MIDLPSVKWQFAGITRMLLRGYPDAARRRQVVEELLDCIEDVAAEFESKLAAPASPSPSPSRGGESTGKAART